MHRKINYSVICWQIGKTSHKAKTPQGEFKVTTSKNPLINNQSSYKYDESYHYPGLSQNTNLQLNFRFNTQLNLIM